METIQWRLRKLGARVQECKERITIALPSSCPVAPVLRRCLTLLERVRLTSHALWVPWQWQVAQVQSGGCRPAEAAKTKCASSRRWDRFGHCQDHL